MYPFKSSNFINLIEITLHSHEVGDRVSEGIGHRNAQNLERIEYRMHFLLLTDMACMQVSKVMKDWSDLEEKYQEMRNEDPASAEAFKKQMTDR